MVTVLGWISLMVTGLSAILNITRNKESIGWRLFSVTICTTIFAYVALTLF